MTTVNELENMYDEVTQAANSGIISRESYYYLVRDVMDKISNLEECWEDNGVTDESKRLDLLAEKVNGVLHASL